jgi:hypothetical protein
MRDIFEDIGALAVPEAELETVKIAMATRPARARQAQPFGMIGLTFAQELGGVFCVATHLAHQMALSGGKPVPATAERTGCAHPHTRHRALRLLEKMGRAEIEWRGNGSAPIIKRFDHV